MNWCKVLCALSIAIYGSTCVAQDITDVEAKPYGSYTDGAIDTIDMATGNLMLHIPLISFPQKGSLPPLSFSVEANIAPYSQNQVCSGEGIVIGNDENGDPVYGCPDHSSRYDTSPPGAPTMWLEEEYDFNYINGIECCSWVRDSSYFHNLGVYMTSSFEGGVVTGQLDKNTSAGLDSNSTYQFADYSFSAIDPSGTTHELESDASNPPASWNIYRTPDGSGYTFYPSGTRNVSSGDIVPAYNPFDSTNLVQGAGNASSAYWIGTPPNNSAGLRLGTLISPTGIQYSDSIVPFPAPSSAHALQSTATDPSGNTITRGPWYWSGYGTEAMSIWDLPDGTSSTAGFYTNNPPLYHDSVGRVIPDIISMQATEYKAIKTGYGFNIPWDVPGYGTYVIKYIQAGNGVDMAALEADTQNGLWPDPAAEVQTIGYTISSIVLPNQTAWCFIYKTTGTDDTPQCINAYSLGQANTAASGDLVMVITPSGGSISYTYTTAPNPVPYYDSSMPNISRCNGICHAVSSRTETDNLGHSWTKYFTYNTYNNGNMGYISSTPYTPPSPPTDLTSTLCHTYNGVTAEMLYAYSTTETDPSGNDTVHNFCVVENSKFSNVPVANMYHEVLTDYYQGCLSQAGCSGERQLLKSVATHYTYQNDIDTPSSGRSWGIINFLPTEITTSIPNPGYNSVADSCFTGSDTDTNRSYSKLFTAQKISCSSTDCGIIKGTNVDNIDHIDISYQSPSSETIWGSGTTCGVGTFASNIGEISHTTSTTYMFQSPISSAYTDANLVALPRLVNVADGYAGESGTTEYKYDEPNYSPSDELGNLTTKSETYYYNMGHGSTTHTSYSDSAPGMPVAKIDANGHTTTITYDSYGLFPLSVQRPTTNGVSHTDSYTHDWNTSELLSHTDENNQTTSYSYDLMGRVASITYPDKGGSSFCYSDINSWSASGGCTPIGSSGSTPPFSLYTSTQTGTTSAPGASVTTMHTYDGWGRQYFSSVTSDPQGATSVDTTYDWAGRVASVSNPYRSKSESTYGVTSYTYDALGRKTIQTQPDGSFLQWCYDGIGTGQPISCLAGSPYQVDLWDETGRHASQQFDVLGHMYSVFETNIGQTFYTYDTFGDLLTVNQSGVLRNFAYDMPSRVSFACNPEALASGQDCSSNITSTGYVPTLGTRYGYDDNSNLISKKDNRGVTTTYQYDELNRLLSKSYSNDPSGTASSCYLYDSASTNGSGRLGAQWTQAGVCSTSLPQPNTNLVQADTVISAYDPMGRLTSESRCIGVANCAGSNSLAMNYSYDRAGKLLTYPSGYGNLNFTNNYDAVGHLSSVIQGSQNLFMSPAYTSAGALSGAQFGTAFNMGRTFDSRQRVLTETDVAIPQQ